MLGLFLRLQTGFAIPQRIKTILLVNPSHETLEVADHFLQDNHPEFVLVDKAHQAPKTLL